MSQSTLATQAWTTSQLTGFGRNLGAGSAALTAAPDGSALRRGDVYGYTAPGGTSVNPLVYDGSRWRFVGDQGIVANAAERDLVAILYTGLELVALDTNIEWRYTGSTWVAIGGFTPGLRVTKAGTQAVTNVWTLITWDTPATNSTNPGMFSSATPSRAIAPIRGRYRAACVMNGPTNVQLRYNAAGNSGGGSMQGASVVSAIGLQHTATIDEITLNAGDYLEAFGYSSTATNMGTQSGYSVFFTLSYIGPA